MMSDDRKIYGRDSSVYEFLIESVGDPRKDKKLLKEKSPFSHAKNIDIPILLMHGDSDWIVHIRHSKRMHDALKKEKKNVTFIKYKDEGHRYWSLENEIDHLNEIENFLAKHLPVHASQPD